MTTASRTAGILAAVLALSSIAYIRVFAEPSTHTIDGTVYNYNTPVSGATVTALSMENEVLDQVKTDAKGQFALTVKTDAPILVRFVAAPLIPVRFYGVNPVRTKELHAAMINQLYLRNTIQDDMKRYADELANYKQ